MRSKDEREKLLRKAISVYESKRSEITRLEVERKVIEGDLKKRYKLKEVDMEFLESKLEKLKKEHQGLLEEAEEKLDKVEEILDELED